MTNFLVILAGGVASVVSTVLFAAGDLKLDSGTGIGVVVTIVGIASGLGYLVIRLVRAQNDNFDTFVKPAREMIVQQSTELQHKDAELRDRDSEIRRLQRVVRRLERLCERHDVDIPEGTYE